MQDRRYYSCIVFPALCKLDPWQVVTYHSILIIGSVPTQLSVMAILYAVGRRQKCDEVLTHV